LELGDGWARWSLVDTELFTVERVELAAGATYTGCCDGTTFEIWGCIGGSAAVLSNSEPVELPAVRFGLLPAVLGRYEITARAAATLLRAYVRG